MNSRSSVLPARAWSSAAARSCSTWRRPGSTPAYLRRRASSAAGAPRQQLEVGVPHPRDIATVRGAVVEDGQKIELTGLQRECAEDLVGTGRVLHEQDRDLAVADAQRLSPTERRRNRCQPAHDRLQGHPELETEGGRAQRVVDVVEAGEGESDLGAARGCAEAKARATGAMQADVVRRHV